MTEFSDCGIVNDRLNEKIDRAETHYGSKESRFSVQCLWITKLYGNEEAKSS